MAPALVGVKGASTTGATSGAITCPYGQSPTAGNLLILTLTDKGGTTLPTVSGAWASVVSSAQGGTANIFALVASGGDAAPTVSAVTGQTWTGQCTEWSGCAASSAGDQNGSAHGASGTSLTPVCGAPDATPGELVIWAFRFILGSSGTTTITNTLNNGASANVLDDNASTNATEHHSFGYGITTGNSSATQDAMSWTGTTSNRAGVVATFALAGAAAANSGFLAFM